MFKRVRASWPQPGETNGFLVEHVSLLIGSLRHCGKRQLVAPGLDPVEAARRVYYAPFAVVSHDAAADPMFNYANQTALELFEMPWELFTAVPSRKSVEASHAAERLRILAQLSAEGFVEGYAGVRISRSGKRFLIEQVMLWNLLDAEGAFHGQAAAFHKWTRMT